ncbi:MAG: DUF2147 domain-containing protein [Rhodobacteraceae bacterium]|jgi:uncharacterized protein (DUF2147 family)|nr:imidazoleglycerol-phosphate dehydratase [Marinovum sp.]RZO40309.1 MAG: DUF2147 domain-containing protein [Paracoccaceae bacterium]|tara:strand:- start:611 stop:1003 length:393 start_codon:yes stop_codon:yes gene_type:complete
MKRLICAVFGLVFAASVVAADPIYGLWQTIPDDNGNFGHIEVQDCDGTICGVLMKSFDTAGKSIESDNIGKRIIWNMKSKGDGKYGGGKIWSPDTDKTYASKLELVGDELKVSGCVFIVCRDGGTWTRVK